MDVGELIFGLFFTGIIVLLVTRPRSFWARQFRVPPPFVREDPTPGPSVTVGEVTVVPRYRYAEGSWRTTLTARGPGIPRSLSVAPEGLHSKRGDFVTLDGHFDPLADVRGDVLDVTARLDAEVRRTLEGFLMRDDGRVSGGAVSRAFEGRLEDDALVSAAARVAAVAAAIGRGETPDRLAANAADEPQLELRERNLALLLAHFPDHPKAQALAAPGPRYEAPWIKLLKASARRDPPAVRAAAAEILALRRPAEVDLEVARAGVERLGATGGAEDVLTACLDRYSLRLDAIAALGASGSLDAVATLTGFTRVLGTRVEERRAARAAIAAIQARVGGGGPGHLSLAAPDAGGLAVSEPADEREGAPDEADDDSAAAAVEAAAVDDGRPAG